MGWDAVDGGGSTRSFGGTRRKFHSHDACVGVVRRSFPDARPGRNGEPFDDKGRLRSLRRLPILVRVLRSQRRCVKIGAVVARPDAMRFDKRYLCSSSIGTRNTILCSQICNNVRRQIRQYVAPSQVSEKATGPIDYAVSPPTKSSRPSQLFVCCGRLLPDEIEHLDSMTRVGISVETWYSSTLSLHR